jgi:glycosyltransferase involved in cell wall biosynthesis
MAPRERVKAMVGPGIVSREGKAVTFVTNFSETLLSFRGPLLGEMVKRGHRVHVCSPRAPAEVADGLAAIGVEHHAIPFSRTGLNPIEDLGTFRALTRAFKEISPDIVLTASSKPIIYGSLAARHAGVPMCYSIVTGLGYAFIGNDPKARLVRALVKQLYRLSLKGNRRVFFQNPDNRTLFESLGLLRAPEQAVMINGSGVDLDHFAPAPRAASVSFLLIARLLRDKGVREYVEAARIIRAHHPEVRFRLVGWIDTNPTAIPMTEVQSWMSEGVIEYLGQLDDVRPAIADAAVYVLPSYAEGTPRTVLEAMAMGRPVITTDVPGCRQTVEPGRNGFLVPARNAQALAEAMELFIERAELIESMGQQSRRLAEAKFNVKDVNGLLLNTMEL